MISMTDDPIRDEERDYEEEAANRRDMERERAEELAAAVAEADAGPPMARWAVLAELATVGRLENLPAPCEVTFLDDEDLAARAKPYTVPGGDPLLRMCFDSVDAARAWRAWFGQDPDTPTHRSWRWRGWNTGLSAHQEYGS